MNKAYTGRLFQLYITFAKLVVMARPSKREVVVRDNVIGLQYGETFSPESNFYIKEIVHFLNMKEGSGYFVKIKSTINPSERYVLNNYIYIYIYIYVFKNTY